MSDWVPVVVLPNLRIEAPVGNELIALVPISDARVTSLVSQHSKLGDFLGRFHDLFGVGISPALILLNDDAPESARSNDAVASFRDALALSTIPSERALAIIYPNRPRLQYSNAFEFYPWMVSRDYKYLATNTIAGWGLHRVDKFQGQSSPILMHTTLDQSEIDTPLFEELLHRWSQRYVTKRPRWGNLALFRSLNMAHQAGLLPAALGLTMFDIGRSVALWVSAFEILAHPGVGRSGLMQVYDLLERLPSEYRKLNKPIYAAYYPCRTKRRRRRYASWLYGEIYQVRNAFLHGNRVSDATLRLRPSGRNMFQFAAPLFRIALANFLDLNSRAPVKPKSSDLQAMTDFVRANGRFLAGQRHTEEAILKARKKPKPDDNDE